MTSHSNNVLGFNNDENIRPLNDNGQVKTYKQENVELRALIVAKDAEIGRLNTLVDQLMVNMGILESKMRKLEEKKNDTNHKKRQQEESDEDKSSSNENSNSPPRKIIKV